MGRLRPALAALAVAATALSGCGSSSRSATASGIPSALQREARPIGRGPRFEPPVRGPVVGSCRPVLGPRHGVHVEVFAADRVVIVPAGIGTRPPRSYAEGRIARARCYGSLVTLEPTGVVLVRPDAKLTVGDLFASWGQRLSPDRMASFTAPAGRRVTVYVGGKPSTGSPGSVPLVPHAEIVLEVGPHVPPHTSYTFPPGS